ncbi:hypothetical protein [Dubosiella muris]|uniref:Uncharacterized protein n=1 Tax=Dubosiella muris TaxID=3038133 RepID=A0AC61R478_9FIRM|nr:hypothetical protein [Dubosiella muris]TGY64505.1 hypothetical protein E5336_12010 [Dubosiella muris]
MDVVWEVLFALIFLGLYIWRRKTHGGWIWLLFALFAPIVHMAWTSRFILNEPLVAPLAYGMLCLWTAGMIVPWYCMRKGVALVYSLLDLMSWPFAFFVELQYGGFSPRYAMARAALFLLFGLNAVLLGRLGGKWIQ